MEWTWFLIRAPVDLTSSQSQEGTDGESWGKSSPDAPNVAQCTPHILNISPIYAHFCDHWRGGVTMEEF